MERTLTISVPDHVMIREVGGESVFLDLETEHYFGLDAIGTDILRRMRDGATLGETVDALVEIYDVDEETLGEDIAALLSELEDHGLLTVVAS